jgi:hypothetical protein
VHLQEGTVRKCYVARVQGQFPTDMQAAVESFGELSVCVSCVDLVSVSSRSQALPLPCYRDMPPFFSSSISEWAVVKG